MLFCHCLISESPSTSTTRARPVLFNQRLLSSTPLDTPVKKTLVERNGVLYLNGSTDTQILNATDEALALRLPGPTRPLGPMLASGHIQFVPNPGSSSSFQYSSSVREPAHRVFDAPERTRAALPTSSTNVKPVHDGYSLYSSTISSDAQQGITEDGNAQTDRGIACPFPQSLSPPHQPRTLSNHPNRDINLPYGGYSAPTQYVPSSATVDGQFVGIDAALGAGNPSYTPQRTVVNQHQVSSLGRVHMSGNIRHPFSMVTTTGNDNVLFGTPIMSTAYDHLLSSGSLADSDNTLIIQDLNARAATSYPLGIATTHTLGNPIDSGTRSGTQLATAPVYSDPNARTHVKQAPFITTDFLSGRTTEITGERTGQGTAHSSRRAIDPKLETADRVHDDSTPSETINSQQVVSLLKQLREVVVANRQSEIIDLLNDICEVARTPTTVRSISPTTTVKTTRKLDVDVEMAMQPLRSENAHLRR